MMTKLKSRGVEDILVAVVRVHLNCSWTTGQAGMRAVVVVLGPEIR